jgi:hypothetical protein
LQSRLLRMESQHTVAELKRRHLNLEKEQSNEEDNTNAT